MIKFIGPGNNIWHHSSWSSLVQLMACHLFGAKPLPESMITYFSIGPLGTNSSEICIKMEKK